MQHRDERASSDSDRVGTFEPGRLRHAPRTYRGDPRRGRNSPEVWRRNKSAASRAASATTTAGPVRRFKDAYKQWCDGGWPTLSAPEEFGGQGLPQVLSTALSEYVLSANQSFGMFQGLTSGAIASLVIKGSDEQKAKYLPNMVSGRWTGTMNLTEPHCGTDLGLLKTRAEPQPDGSYSITGTKIFISSGEHDLSEKITIWSRQIAALPTKLRHIDVRGHQFLSTGRLDRNPQPVIAESDSRRRGHPRQPDCVTLRTAPRGGWSAKPTRDGGDVHHVNADRLGVGLQGPHKPSRLQTRCLPRERRQGRALGCRRARGGAKADTIIGIPTSAGDDGNEIVPRGRPGVRDVGRALVTCRGGRDRGGEPGGRRPVSLRRRCSRAI